MLESFLHLCYTVCVMVGISAESPSGIENCVEKRDFYGAIPAHIVLFAQLLNGGHFMKFEALTSQGADSSLLQEEYKQAREIGKLRLGGQHLYFRAGLKTYYLPYADIRRYFRRVMQVPARMCCGKGNFEIENLVICGDRGELAQIQLPGAKAAKAVMECLAELAPEAAVGRSAEAPQ